MLPKYFPTAINLFPIVKYVVDSFWFLKNNI